jgi:hypothetical protein
MNANGVVSINPTPTVALTAILFVAASPVALGASNENLRFIFIGEGQAIRPMTYLKAYDFVKKTYFQQTLQSRQGRKNSTP